MGFMGPPKESGSRKSSKTSSGRINTTRPSSHPSSSSYGPEAVLSLSPGISFSGQSTTKLNPLFSSSLSSTKLNGTRSASQSSLEATVPVAGRSRKVPPIEALSNETLARIPLAEEHEDDCICSICICGKHACPPTPHLSHYDPNLKTEAQDRYRGTYGPPRSPKRPPNGPKPSEPFDGKSMYKDDYRPWDNANRAPLRTSAQMMDTGIQNSDAPFYDETTNKRDFPKWGNVKRTVAAPNHLWGTGKPQPEDRDFGSETRIQYTAKPLPSKLGRAAVELPATLPFHGTTTNKDDFKYHPDARPAPLLKRAEVRRTRPDDRDFASEARSQFVPKRNPGCPAAPIAPKSKPGPGHVLVEKVAPDVYRLK